MSDTIFLTGISGFLASHIALQLLKSGAKVTGSVRALDKADHIRSVLKSHGADTDNLSFVTLDLLDDKGWDIAIQGHDYLIHTASPFVVSQPKDPQILIKPAVEGTARAVNAGLAANVKHIVLTSSIAAAAYGHPKGYADVITENTWTDIQGKDVSPYIMSKTLAEQKAWEIVEKAGKKDLLTVVNPGFILGPVLEKDVGTSGAVIQKMLAGGFPGSPAIWFSCIDVRDAALMHINAMKTSEFFGRRCLAATQFLPFIDIAKGLAGDFPAYRKKLPTRQLPNFLIRLVGLFDSDARSTIPSLGIAHTLDTAPAAQLLQGPLIDARKAAKDMAQSIIDLGLAE